MKTPILGSCYVTRTPNAADNRMVNLFPEIIPEGGKTPVYLQRAPGLRLIKTVGTGPIRGLWTFGNYGYIVSGLKLYRIDKNWDVIELGQVSGTSPVSMSDNGTQLFIACNGPSYIYNSVTAVFEPIISPNFTGAVTVGFLDGYFVYNEPNSQKVWVTNSYDGLNVDALDFASAEGSPDGLISLIIDHREAWLFGTNSVEVWYDAGGTGFPLSPIAGAYNEIGCIAAYSVAKLDNCVFWLGADARGRGIIYQSKGYSAQRISTHAVEWQIQQYADMSDAVAYTYQQDGHSFYVLNFPSANTTWVYDVATTSWHERAGFSNGKFTRHRSNCQMSFNDEIIVGDYQNGKIYAFDLNVYSDDDQIQKWLRSWRALPTDSNNLTRTAQHSLQLDCETGVGVAGFDPNDSFIDVLATESGDTIVTESGNGILVDYVTNTAALPEVMLRWSDDGGHTWSNEHWRSMGKIGAFGHRTIWRRLGMTLKIRDRVYELSGTDAVKVNIMGAELIMSSTNA